MKKTIMILLSCIMLASCLVSCDIGDISQEPTQQEPESFEQSELPTQTEHSETLEPVDYTKESDTPYRVIPYDMGFAADFYLAAGERVEADYVYVDVTDGKVTWEDVLFDEISYEQNIDVKYDSSYHCYASDISIAFDGAGWDIEDKNEIRILMTRIAQQKHCYILRSSTANEVADCIAAYYLDGVCYFAFIKNDVVSKIYCFEAAYAEPVLTEGMEIQSERTVSWGWGSGIEEHSTVHLTVVDGRIYNDGRLQKIKYYGGIRINVEWCRQNLAPADWSIDKTIGMELLERMNEEAGCFVIVPDDEEAYYDYTEIAIYVINGVYYFVDITKAYWRDAYILDMSSGVPLAERE